jgi:hypothetical protein
MSLDFYLSQDGKEMFSRNITHNLGKMADAAGIYKCLWRPEENGFVKASQCVEPLKAGLLALVSDPERFQKFDSPNGWGLWEHFLPFCASYLQACQDHPDALVKVSR